MIPLIEKVQKILEEEINQGKDKLKSSIKEIAKSQNGKKMFFAHGIVYLPSKGKAVVVGDTHGDLEATQSILKQTEFEKKRRKGEKLTIIFLGDYIDRGLKQEENLKLVLNLKINYPPNVILLRGNHEEPETNSFYGFLSELTDKYGQVKGIKLWREYNQFFENLPILCVISNGIVIVHAGIPKVESRICGLDDLTQDKKLSWQMRWNDPRKDLDWFAPSERGPDIYYFGKKALVEFLEKVAGRLLIRSHEYPERGFKIMLEDKLMTIFSTGGKSKSSAYRNFVLEPRFLEIELEKEIPNNLEKWIRDIQY